MKNETQAWKANLGELAQKRFNEFQTFRTNLVILRNARGITGEHLGEILKIRPKRVYDFETGRCHPDFYQLTEMARLFEVTLDQLLYKKAIVSFEE